jgi:hypothetical protein
LSCLTRTISQTVLAVYARNRGFSQKSTFYHINHCVVVQLNIGIILSSVSDDYITDRFADKSC